MLSQVKRVIRTNYSNPPTHGGTVVANVLNSPELRAMWEQELGEMRDRIKLMRHARRQAGRQGCAGRLLLRQDQRGMFSYSGLNSARVDRLRNEHGIYAVGTGRICVAALNSRNIDAVVDAIATVM